MALCISVKVGDILKIGDAEVEITGRTGNLIRLAISADKMIPIKRIAALKLEKKDAAD